MLDATKINAILDLIKVDSDTIMNTNVSGSLNRLKINENHRAVDTELAYLMLLLNNLGMHIPSGINYNHDMDAEQVILLTNIKNRLMSYSRHAFKFFYQDNAESLTTWLIQPWMFDGVTSREGYIGCLTTLLKRLPYHTYYTAHEPLAYTLVNILELLATLVESTLGYKNLYDLKKEVPTTRNVNEWLQTVETLIVPRQPFYRIPVKRTFPSTQVYRAIITVADAVNPNIGVVTANTRKQVLPRTFPKGSVISNDHSLWVLVNDYKEGESFGFNNWSLKPKG